MFFGVNVVTHINHNVHMFGYFLQYNLYMDNCLPNHVTNDMHFKNEKQNQQDLT